MSTLLITYQPLDRLAPALIGAGLFLFIFWNNCEGILVEGGLYPQPAIKIADGELGKNFILVMPVQRFPSYLRLYVSGRCGRHAPQMRLQCRFWFWQSKKVEAHDAYYSDS
jgi:hypothetical protein